MWALIKLKRWHPKIIVVTGSAGKTTLLHLLEAQLGDDAHYSHHANSAYGIAFDILGLHGVTRSRFDWIGLLLKAPLKAFNSVYSQKIYVAEVDTDRPKEGAFLAKLLKPDITLWVSLLHTHAAQFDADVVKGKFKTPEEAIAYDYGNVIAATKELVIMDGDNPAMAEQAKRTKAQVQSVSTKDLSKYELIDGGTRFVFDRTTYELPAIVPKASFYQVAMADKLLAYLQRQPDYTYKHFELPPGRSNIFKGIKDTTLIDSTYNNSNITTLSTIIELFTNYPATQKWAVIGDMLEQGQNEAREHQKLAAVLNDTSFDHLILVGSRVKAYTAPALSSALQKRTKVEVIERPADVLAYLQANLSGGETILFKGVRYLEGVIEGLLADKADAVKLPRREPLMQKRRQEWGL